MTYEKFKDIEYMITSEKDWFCYACARTPHKKEHEEKYEEFRKRAKKISEFKKKVLTEALKNIPDNYF